MLLHPRVAEICEHYVSVGAMTSLDRTRDRCYTRAIRRDGDEAVLSQ